MQLSKDQYPGFRLRLAHILFFLAVALACFPAHAQILIGQTAGFHGPVAARVKEAAGYKNARMLIEAEKAFTHLSTIGTNRSRL
jgi:hypothetical protein